MKTIRAGRTNDIDPNSGEWVFVDPGFSQSARSCGFLLADGDPQRLTFSDLTNALLERTRGPNRPLNLVIEAPLSVAFGANGNPQGRSIERRNGQSRYWYVGLGCTVLVAATHLLRALSDSDGNREVRLFEGFVSFKPKGVASDHCRDVLDLRAIVRGEPQAGRIIAPEALPLSPEDRLVSAFKVAGMDFGLPPVLVVGG